MKIARLLAVVAVGVFFTHGAALAQSFDSGASGSPSPNLSGVKIVQRLGGSVDVDATFKDRNGQTVRISDFLHKRPLVIVPIFYRCLGVCTLEMQSFCQELPKTHLKVGRDLDVVVLSIDPQEGPDLAREKWADTLQEQPAFKGTDSGWHFLTGTLADIHAVTDALGYYYTYDPETDIINHPSGIAFISPDGKISSYILGEDYPTAKLSTDIFIAGKGKIGDKVQEVFFGCIHIDPLTGQRSIVIEKVLRVLGVLTIVGVVSLIAFSSRRSSRAKKSVTSEIGQPPAAGEAESDETLSRSTG